ncbi:hypothetical protein [Bellilinea sp.]
MPNSIFHRLLASFRIELRLILFNWVYPLLHLLWGILFYQLFVGKDDRSAIALLETTVGRLAIGLISLIGLFLAGISASRSKRVRFLELEETYPTGFEIIAGRWTAGFVALLLFLTEPILIAAKQGPLTSLLEGLPVFLFEAGLTVAFVTVLAWVVLFGQTFDRWAYMILAAFWLSFLLGPSLLVTHFPPASLLNFMRQGVSFYSDVWGRMVYGDQPIWFNLFYVGMLLFCLGLLILAVYKRRFHHLSRPAVLLLLGGLILAGWGGTRYINTVLQAVDSQPQVDLLSSDSADFGVEDYHLVLDLADPSVPRFQVTVEVSNTGEQPLDQLIFRLNRSFSITKSNFQTERKGNLIFINLSERLLPGESQFVILSYEGALRVERVSRGVVEATDFIDSRGIRLTPLAEWYPIPALSNSAFGQHEPAHFSIQVVNNPGLPLAANLPAIGENVFEADQVTWVFLVASPRLKIEQIDKVILITARSDLEKGRELADDYSRALRSITPFFPDANVHGMILMVLGEERGLPDYTPPVSGYPLVVTQRYAKRSWSTPDTWQTFVTRTITVDLWQMEGGKLDSRYNRPLTSLDQAFDALVSFLSLYHRENGNLDRMLAGMKSPENLSGSAIIDENLQILVEIYREGGQEAIVSVLQKMLLQSDELQELPYDALPIWFRSAWTTL